MATIYDEIVKDRRRRLGQASVNVDDKSNLRGPGVIGDRLGKDTYVRESLGSGTGRADDKSNIRSPQPITVPASRPQPTYGDRLREIADRYRSGQSDVMQSYTDYIGELQNRLGETEKEQERAEKAAKSRKTLSAIFDAMTATGNLITTIKGATPAQLSSQSAATESAWQGERDRLEAQRQRYNQLLDAAEGGKAKLLSDINGKAYDAEADALKAEEDARIREQQRADDMAKAQAANELKARELGIRAADVERKARADAQRAAERAQRQREADEADKMDKAEKSLSRRYGNAIKYYLPDGQIVVLGENTLNKNLAKSTQQIYDSTIADIDSRIEQLGGVNRKGKAKIKDNEQQVNALRARLNDVKMKYMQLKSEADRIAFALEYSANDPETVQMIRALADDYYNARVSAGLPELPEQEGYVPASQQQTPQPQPQPQQTAQQPAQAPAPAQQQEDKWSDYLI